MLKAITTAALVLASTSASATVFDLTYYSRLELEPTPSHMGNRADMPIVATGQIEIDDAAIAPNAFLPLTDRAVKSFSTTYNHDGLHYQWTLGHDFLRDRSDQTFGFLFDAEGQPLRFEIPETVVSNVGFFEDVDAVDRRPFPQLIILDDDRFDLVFAEETIDRLGNRGPVAPGELVSLAVLPVGSKFTPLANRWSINRIATPGGDQGVLLISGGAGGGGGGTQIPPIPVPGSGLLLLSALGAIAAVRRRRG